MATERPDEHCENCRFWHRHGEEDSGSCCRHPPQLSDAAVRFYAENPDPDRPEPSDEAAMLRALRGLDVWFEPVTHSSSWCGEWQPPPAGNP